MKNKYIILYYCVLLSILISWTDMMSAPAMVLRIAFLIAFALPAAIFKNWIPIVFSCFMTVATQGFAYSYFPSGLNYYGYCAIFTILIISISNKDSRFSNIPAIVYILAALVTLVDLITSSGIGPFTYLSFLIVSVLYGLDEKVNIGNKWSFAFALATLVLSAAFMLNRDKFISIYDEGYERTSWTDPNYFGMVLGMGTVSSVNELLFRYKEKKILLKILYIATIVLSLPVLFLNASRGAILSVSVGVIISLFFSKTKTIYKAIAICAMSFFLIYLYTSQYLDLFLYRVNNLQGGTTTNGRFEIWESKVNAFFDEGSFFNYIFGVGYEDAINYGAKMRFHNDFVAFFVEYGFIGLVLFLSFLLAPLKSFYRNNTRNTAFVSCYFYLIFCLFSLEPFSIGTISFALFYSYTLYLSNHSVNENA